MMMKFARSFSVARAVGEKIGGGLHREAIRTSLSRDALALSELKSRIDEDGLIRAASCIHECRSARGRVLVSGVGKSGIVARRMAASLASTGTPAHFVHAAEFMHGDLGAAQERDAVLMYSHSGNTEECTAAAEWLRRRDGVALISIVGCADSELGRTSDHVVSYEYPNDTEAYREPLGSVPTTSLVVQEAVSNAIICCLMHEIDFDEKDFSLNHPGGSIGKRLSSHH